MNNNPFVSIIVPVSKWNSNLRECVENCLKINYPKYEVIILPDNPEQELRDIDSRVREIPTGKIGPAEKRNIGVDNSKGEIIAFIDDDTYPMEDWLRNAVKNFSDPEVAAVGGPAITPQSDNNLRRASGAVYESFLGGGGYRYRYIPGEKQYVDDFPSCNLIVRKDIFKQLGGFRTNYWPGEDTVLCLDIVHKMGKKMIYEPSAVIYHHRRELFKSHIKQVSAYALHRGYFAKKFPKTSLRLSYFIPSAFVVFLLLGWIFNVKIYLSIIVLYFLLALVSSMKFRGIRILTFLGIVSTHVAYGVFFVRGLFSFRLREDK